MLQTCSDPSGREKLACSRRKYSHLQNAQAERICKTAVGCLFACTVASFSSLRAQMGQAKGCRSAWTAGLLANVLFESSSVLDFR